jgi:hypothetical protein
MTTVEIRQSIDQMTDEERFFATAYLQHLSQQQDPQYQTMLSERMQRMDAGKKVTLEQAVKIHQALKAEGI